MWRIKKHRPLLRGYLGTDTFREKIFVLQAAGRRTCGALRGACVMSSAAFVTTAAAHRQGVHGVSTGSGLFGTTQVENPAELRTAGNGALALGGDLHSKFRISDDDAMIGASVSLGGEFWSGRLGSEMTNMMELRDQQSGEAVKCTRQPEEQRCP